MTLLYSLLFSESEYSYNHKLAQKSLDLAISAFSSEESLELWGEDKACGREEPLNTQLRQLGFYNTKFFNYDVSLNDASSKVAFSISKAEYDNSTTLIAVVIRGGRYGLEWVDNFNVGGSDEAYHRGFYDSAVKVKNKVDEIWKDIPKEKTVKLWITGYSRGGAVANILGSMYDNTKELNPCQVYTYTFASPKTAVISSLKCHDTIYRNIFNILSPNDPVYNIPPSDWGFGRFGICVVFPNNNSENENEINTRKMVYDDYRNRTGKTPITTGVGVDTLVGLIIKSAQSRDFFYDNIMVPLENLILIKMFKYKNNNGIWTTYTMDSAIKELYGDEVYNQKEKLKNSYLFNSLKKLGVKIPEDFYVFISLCIKQGYVGYENRVFEKLGVDELMGLSKISSGGSWYMGHTSDFYLSWISNVPVAQLKFIKY